MKFNNNTDWLTILFLNFVTSEMLPVCNSFVFFWNIRCANNNVYKLSFRSFLICSVWTNSSGRFYEDRPLFISYLEFRERGKDSFHYGYVILKCYFCHITICLHSPFFTSSWSHAFMFYCIFKFYGWTWTTHVGGCCINYLWYTNQKQG